MKFSRSSTAAFVSLFAMMVVTPLIGVAAGEDSPAKESAASSTTPPAASSQADYILQPFDLIKVEVFEEPDLEREVRISEQSTVTLPLIGPVDLKGKSVRRAQELVRELYRRDYFVNPQINIIVLDYAKWMVNVLGAVNTPGAVLIPPDQPLNLLDAIARAGGFSRLADRKHVKLTRLLENGKTKTNEINADDIIQSTSGNVWVLKKDDVVFVPERIL